MLIGTHTLLPVCLGLAAENFSLAKGRGYVFPPWSYFAIGFFGALPDLCTPHISLESRYESWSHTLWFLAAVALVAGMVTSFFQKEGRRKLTLACWLASLLHLIGDAVAGGIAWKKPWGPDIIGKFYIPPADWLWYDIGFVLLTWILFRLRPHAEARGMGASAAESSAETQV
ncbi:metal-dependent hydrolase [Luteolibacter soli]|uniref:Metal-dependent hydrolase n=1 Tax=Luteolibacter soli TaxID=3135280 RepID=A0ABU9B2E7_9BACT